MMSVRSKRCQNERAKLTVAEEGTRKGKARNDEGRGADGKGAPHDDGHTERKATVSNRRKPTLKTRNSPIPTQGT